MQTSTEKSLSTESPEDNIQKVMKAMGLDSPDEIRERQAFIGLSPEDIDRVRRAKPIIDKQFQIIIDAIYVNLNNFPETAKHLTSAAQIEQLKSAQKLYFDALLSGRYDLAYVQNVMRVGLAHVRIDLKPKWYIGNYCVYVCKVVEALVEESLGKPGQRRMLWKRSGASHGNGSHDLGAVITSVLKTFFLDMALTMEAYIGPLMSEMADQNEKSKAGVEKLQALSRSIGDDTRENNENVQKISSAAEEMSATIKEISENIQKSTQISNEAVSKSDQANIVMTKLDESSQEIGKVVKVIRSIAQQTNLLALNATIEAARAGEAGKGFAVVANEVKDLAKETADATEKIGQRIATIQKDTAEAVSSISEVGKIIAQFNDFCVGVAGAVEEQTATTEEINRSITGTAIGTANILKKMEEAEKVSQ